MAATRRARRWRAVLAVLAAASVVACGVEPGEEARVTRTILVTGFGPFGGYESNPAWESIRHLDGAQIGGSRIRTARIDVVYATAEEQLTRALDAARPDAVLSLGVAPDRVLRVETVARNLDDSHAADNAGEVRQERTIVAGERDLATRLPVEAILSALEAGGFEARTSRDAGGYLCNHLFFHVVRRVPADRIAGFVHVPELEGTWDLDRLRRAVRRILEVIDGAVRESPESPPGAPPVTRGAVR